MGPFLLFFVVNCLVIPTLDKESEIWRNYSLLNDPMSIFRIIENSKGKYFNPSPKKLRGLCYKKIDESRDAIRSSIKKESKSNRDKYRALTYLAWGDSRYHYLTLSPEDFINHREILTNYIFD